MLGVGSSIWNRALAGKGAGNGGNPPAEVTPIHALDLTTAPSASNSFDDYGLALPRTVTDYNGRIVTIPADAVPMGGLRHVRNLLQAANDFENAAWVASMSGTGTLPIITPAFTTHTVNGNLVDVTRVQFACGAGVSSSDFSIVQQIVSSHNPLNYVPCGSIYCKLNAGTSADMYLRVHATDTSSSVAITDEWQRVSVAGVSTGSYNVLTFGLRGTATAGTQTVDVLVCCATSQDITHRADLSTAPDEYVSTADDYGTGVNGFRYFDTELANTVASNVVTEGTGASIDGWLDYQPGATNSIIESADFTSATWIKNDVSAAVGTTIAPDGTLADVVSTISAPPNSSRIRIGFIPATSGQTYCFSVYLRDESMTQNVSLRLQAPGGAVDVVQNFTLTSDWQRLYVTATLDASFASVYLYLNPNGDAGTRNLADSVSVWGAQLETGTVPTAYIPTSGGSAYRPAMSPAPTISGLVGTEDARLTVKGLAADLVTPDPTDDTERTLDIDNTDGEFDTLPSPIKVLSIDVYNDGERPA